MLYHGEEHQARMGYTPKVKGLLAAIQDGRETREAGEQEVVEDEEDQDTNEWG